MYTFSHVITIVPNNVVKLEYELDLVYILLLEQNNVY